MREGYVTSVPLLCGQRLAFPDLSLRLPSATALCGVASELDWEHLRRIELDTLADLILAEPWQGQVTWRVPLDTDDFGRVLDLLPALRSPGIELQVDLADPALVAKAVFATSLGIRVRVRLRPLGGEALVELNRLASSYLLGPAPRRAALEPFATLEREILAGGDGGLWVACEESPSDHLYLGENGLLALSRRFAEAGHAYGPLAELEGHGWERT
ncbi:MAG: hypothetical protein RBU30_06620, partial [Polyangia bacterium]|nr:hypothetical protein [Polyangia bacterium]